MTDDRFTNAWQAKTDDEVVEASFVLSDYTEDGEHLIRAELRRRGLTEPGPPVGACASCLRSVHANHPTDRCVQCDAPLPAALLERLRQLASDSAGAAGETPGPLAADDTAAAGLQCVRCGAGLDYQGTKKFHEGTRWGALGDLAELFQNREHFDIYVCPRCGRVEFFVDGVGEDLRSGR